jgi:hypothetical protein
MGAKWVGVRVMNPLPADLRTQAWSFRELAEQQYASAKQCDTATSMGVYVRIALEMDGIADALVRLATQIEERAAAAQGRAAG